MPTRRSLKDSLPAQPPEGKAASARPSAKGKRVASARGAAAEKKPKEKRADQQEELASSVSSERLSTEEKPVQRGAFEAEAQSAGQDVTGDTTGSLEKNAAEDTRTDRAVGGTAGGVRANGAAKAAAENTAGNIADSGKKDPVKRPSARGRRVRVSKPSQAEESLAATTEKSASSRKAPKKHHSPLRIFLAILGGIFAALLVAATAFALDRWVLHDDAADLQGTWYLYGTSIEVPIDQKDIVISSDASYRYTIDTTAKTISYSIGNLTGISHYRFSSDRSQVALIEDGKKVFTATLLDDVSWWFTSLRTAFSGEIVLPAPLSGDVVLLSRTPYVPAPTVESGDQATVQPDASTVDVDQEEAETEENVQDVQVEESAQE